MDISTVPNMSTFGMKFKSFSNKIFEPKSRKLLLMVSSGIFILLALVIGKLFPMFWLGDLFMILAALIAGSDIAIRAFRSLRNKHISIELLVTIATTGALIIGEYWEAAAVTFLFIVGAYLESRTLSHTRKVLQGLLDLAPTTVLVLRNGEQIEVNPMEVERGEIVVFKPGSKIAVDGIVVSGHSTIDESAITGEFLPAEKETGSQVFAGTINLDGMIKVEALKVGIDTTLAKIIHRVEEAQDEKAPTQRFIERFAQWYTPFIIGLSVVAYFISMDIELALTLLVIGCPGALVISTPVSIVAGIGSAAKKGILIKGGEYLENAGKISAVAFDKTGTLTEGKPFVSDVVVLNSDQNNIFYFETKQPIGKDEFKWNDSQLRVLQIAAVAESGSEHPLAKAVIQAAGIEVFEEIERFDTFTSRGVKVIFQGNEIVVGSNQFFSDQKIVIPNEVKEYQQQLKSEGKTTILVSVQNIVIGLIAIADKPRKNAIEALKKLKEIGIDKVVMLTGDDRITANSIAKKLGLTEVESQLLPDEKLEIIRNLQKDGHIVAMIGDGINDAPALAAANLGIAMGVAGTDVAIETADIALMADDLMKIPEAIRVSKLTLRNIRQNVVIALVTVTALLLGVIFGKIHMAGGMFIHEASVLLVILNGMRLLKVA